LFQAWSFVAPGLYKHEKRLAAPLLASSIILFYCGMLFAFYIVFPLVFGFFTSVGPEMVSISTDIGRYLDFVLSLFFGFGLAFEIPIATIILVALGMTTPDQLAEKRPFVIVGVFVIGMLLTPPDIISQVMLAVPMWLLFESGVLASRYIFADKLKKQAQEAAEMEAEQAEADAEAARDPAEGNSIYGDEFDVVDDPVDANESGHDEYEPLTEEEMEAELDRIESEEDDDDQDEDSAPDTDANDAAPSEPADPDPDKPQK
jgi:sec-independent protein translocase protein TatC